MLTVLQCLLNAMGHGHVLSRNSILKVIIPELLLDQKPYQLRFSVSIIEFHKMKSGPMTDIQLLALHYLTRLNIPPHS